MRGTFFPCSRHAILLISTLRHRWPLECEIHHYLSAECATCGGGGGGGLLRAFAGGLIESLLIGDIASNSRHSMYAGIPVPRSGRHDISTSPKI